MKRKLNFLIQPKTIAVIGASDKQDKVGFSVMKNLISSGFPDNGDLFPINPRLDAIMGYKAYKSVLDVPKEIDLVVVCIPAKIIIDVIKECGKKRLKEL